jgi:hypothetical protein
VAKSGLQLVPGTRQHQHQKKVGHGRDGHFVLTGADGFHQNHVETGGLANHYRGPGCPRHAPQRACGGRRANEGIGVMRQFGHARLITEDTAAADRAGWVDGKHRDLLPRFDQPHPEALDEGALADAGHAGDADSVSPLRLATLTEIREQSQQNLLSQFLMSWAAALDDRDRAPDHRAIAG